MAGGRPDPETDPVFTQRQAGAEAALHPKGSGLAETQAGRRKKPRQHKRKRMRGGISETTRQGPRPLGATLRGKGNARAGDEAKLASWMSRSGDLPGLRPRSETERPGEDASLPGDGSSLGRVGAGGDTSPHFVMAAAHFELLRDEPFPRFPAVAGASLIPARNMP